MAAVTDDTDAERAASLRRRYLIRFEEDTLRERPLWIRLIIEFLGALVLVTVAAGSGVINHYAGGNPDQWLSWPANRERRRHLHSEDLGRAQRARPISHS